MHMDHFRLDAGGGGQTDMRIIKSIIYIYREREGGREINTITTTAQLSLPSRQRLPIWVMTQYIV
jgi:hypothetical protein